MKRVEIITNQAIAEDILEELENHGIGDNYTLIPHVHGRGSKGTRLGTPLWPEENCIYLLYLDDAVISDMKAVIKSIKKRFPNEGTKLFISAVEN